MNQYKVLIEHERKVRVYETVLAHSEADAEYKAIKQAWQSKDAAFANTPHEEGMKVKGIVLNEDQGKE
jgi:hypothetical protein